MVNLVKGQAHGLTTFAPFMCRNRAINLAACAGLFLAIATCGAMVNLRAIFFTAYKTTKGSVSQTFPDNHAGFAFTYQANGYRYEGRSYAGQINRAFSDIRPGDAVTVFYDERRPDKATLESPKVLLVQLIGQIIGASAILSGMGMCFLRRYGFLPAS